MKPGYKTTEFYLVIISSVLAVAVAAGYVSSGEATEISNSAAQVIEAVSKLVGALAPVISVVSYVWSRTKVKAAAV